MSSVTISSKFQILIPKRVREQLHLHVGQKLIFITIGKTIRLVPQFGIEDICGIDPNANTSNIRDRTNRKGITHVV